MKNETLKKVTEYAKTRFTRLLILLVIFTFGFSMKTAVLAKYTSYINNLTSVVAGDFIFKSDYLSENGVTYNVNSFNGSNHEIEFELMNYENALRYNEVGRDCLYTVEAKVYQKNPNGDLVENTNYAVKITYDDSQSDSNGVVAAYRGKIGNDGTMPKKEESAKYGVLRGIDTSNTSFASAIGDGHQGKNTVKVFISSDTPTDAGKAIYLKVLAKTVPSQVMKEEIVKHDATLSDRRGKYVIQTCEGYDDIATNVDENRGIYYSELSATFILNRTASDAVLISEVYPGASTNYEVTYRLRCNDSTNGEVIARVYYDSNKVIPDSSLGTPNYDRGTDTTGRGTKNRFFQIQCKPGGTKSMKFYKNSLAAEIITDDNENSTFYTEVITDTTQMDENLYTISVASDSGGNVTTQPEAAKMTTDVVLTVTPPTGKIIDHIQIVANDEELGLDSFEVPISSSSIASNNVGTFYFKMPNVNVKVYPYYCFKIGLECGEHGTASISRSGAPAGTPISVMTAPESGYQAKVTVQWSGGQFDANDDGNNAFSFDMPDTLEPVTVKVTFEPITSPVEPGTE